MVRMIAVKCPECNAQLKIKEGHRECYCAYCGAKIIVDDGSTTKTFRDEARIKEAEVKEQIRLKELELEMDERLHERNILKIKIIISVILGAAGILFWTLDDVNANFTSVSLVMFLILAWIWLGSAISEENKKKK